MDNFLIGNITGSVYLDTRRPKLIDNKIFYPVKARVTHNRSRLYVALGFDLTESDFNKLHSTKSSELIKTKKLITASFERIKSIVEEIHKTEEYSHDKLRNKLKKGRKSYLDAAFDNRIAELTANGQAGTAASYITAKKFIEKYQRGLRFVDITPQWLTKFEAWALNKEGVNETSLSIYLRALRALFNDAIRGGDVPKGAYPFYSKDTDGYRIPTGTGTKIALTVEQINAIAKLELTGSPERCRDMFLLSFHLGGINFKDMLLLKWKNIKNGEVHFIREKTKHTNRTGKTIVVPLTEPARRIVERWGNADRSPDAYVIPHLTDGLTPEKLRDSVKSYTKQVNKQLKKIGETLSINGLSTYVARHSFATILKNSGAPIAFIGETLGHTSTKTTENYLKSFESEQKRKHFEAISNIGG
jgi:integrase